MLSHEASVGELTLLRRVEQRIASRRTSVIDSRVELDDDGAPDHALQEVRRPPFRGLRHCCAARNVASPEPHSVMAWGTAGARPPWLDQLERDDPALSELLCLQPLDERTWALVAAALAKSTRLKSLIVHKPLDPRILSALAAACGSSQLESISVGTHALGDSGAATILPAFARCASLTSCDLECRGISDESAEGLIALLAPSAPARLRVLSIARNEALSGSGISQVAAAVAASSLTSLDLSGLSIGEDGASALGRMCAYSTLLHKLVLKAASWGPTGASSFAQAITQPAAALASIDLSDVALGGGAALLLRTLAAKGPALTSLGLDRCSLPADAFDELSAVLALPLRALRLQGCGLGDAGAAKLALAISRRRPPLETLHVGANGMRADGAVPLLRACAEIPTMRVLDCIGNPLGDDGARGIAGIVASDLRRLVGHLVSLSLNACEIGIAGFDALSAAFQTGASDATAGAPPHSSELITIELAQNPACQDDAWAAAVEKLGASRPEVALVWKARGEEQPPRQ